MNTKVLLFTVIGISLFVASVQTATADASDYAETSPGFTTPEDDPAFLETFSSSDGESEEQNNTVPNEDPEDTTEETASDEDIPENERTHEDGVVADGEYHPFFMNTCEFAEVLLKGKAVEINVNSIFNTEAVVVTSIPFRECDDISKFDCPNEGFCQIQDIENDGDGVSLGTEACDVEVLYVYPIPVQSDQKMDLEIKVTFNDDLQCDNTSASTPSAGVSSDDEANESSSETSGETSSADVNSGTSDSSSETSGDELVKAEEVCGSRDVDTCQTGTDACSSQCMWITCSVKTEEGQVTNTSSSCVPLAYSQRNLQQECEAKDEFATASTNNQVIDYPVCDAAEQDQSSSDSINLQHPVAKIFGAIVVSILTLFVATVCFYRCQFRKNGEGPFNPPSCCPGFIFPRHKTYGFATINTDKRQELMDYEPPVPVL